MLREPDAPRTIPGSLPALSAIASVVEAASELVQQMQRDPVHDWQKVDDSPVTDIDIAVDRFLCQHLRPLFPEAGWLSEETADDPSRLGYRYLWVVDPIDGTRSLLAGLPEFCISVALVESGVGPRLGIIANPSTGERFLAQSGKGAYDQNGRRLQVRSAFDAQDMRLLVSRSDLSAGLWQGVVPHEFITPVGSLAYKMGLVATGAYDGHVTPTPRSEWDAAAGALILAEAGGISTDLGALPLRYNQSVPRYDGMVVASHASHAHMLALGARTTYTAAALRP